MKLKCSVFTVCLFLLVSNASAADHKDWPVLETKDKKFSNARLVKIEPDGIRIIHDAGAAKIPYERLHEAERGHFHFNSEAAAAFREHIQKQRTKDFEQRLAEFKSREAEAKKSRASSGKLRFRYMMVKVAEVLPDGSVFCHPHESGAPLGDVVQAFNVLRRPCNRVTHAVKYTDTEQPMIITNVQGTWAEGDVLQGMAARAGVKQYEGRSIAWFVSK